MNNASQIILNYNSGTSEEQQAVQDWLDGVKTLQEVVSNDTPAVVSEEEMYVPFPPVYLIDKIVYLRHVDGVIETSSGFSVPTDDLEELWNKAKTERSTYPVGYTVGGQFPLDNIDEYGGLHICCAYIPFSELERMAQELDYE